MKSRKRTGVLRMKVLREMLRLRFELRLSCNKIAESCNLSRSTVQNYVNRAEASGVSLGNLDSLGDEELVRRVGKVGGRQSRNAEPDHQEIARELCKPGVTKALLWEEYKKEHPDGHCYSGFCNSFRKWKKDNRLSMRQQHKAGEKLYVDYAGQTVPIYRRGTNEVEFKAQIFVAAFGASNFTFVDATESQEIKHWIGSHVRCFEFFGGVPQAVVPDNLKSGVTKAIFYEPDINTIYRELAEHYGLAILPTRKRKPKDKAKVEVGVQIVERWILAALRNRKFFSLSELKQEVARLLDKINEKKMRNYGLSRGEMFEMLDKPALRPLPPKPYQFFAYKLVRVNIDYHIELEQHYYSVPYQLVHKEVEVRIRENTVEVLSAGKRVALHALSKEKFRHSTKKEHMPPSHQAVLKWTPSRLIDWASKNGPQTKAQVEGLLNSRQHPEQSYRACLGLLRLGKTVGAQRLEAACARANHLGINSYRNIKSILDSGMDRLPIVETKDIAPVRHKNLRGGGYYH